VICKARHSTPSSDFEKQVHKEELFLFFISIFSDCFFLNDPGSSSFVHSSLAPNLFYEPLCFSPILNQFLAYLIQPPNLTTLLMEATSRGLNVRAKASAKGSDLTLRC
jgi:hypothetical protein